MHFLFFYLQCLQCVSENNKPVIYFSLAPDSRALTAFEATFGVNQLWQMGSRGGTLMRFAKVHLA